MNRMRKMLKKCAALVFGVLFSATTLGAVSRHVTFLQYYEQLSSYTGQDGIYFVSEAASSSADGRHGDPTVQKGWAMYVYQGTQATAGSGVSRGGWRKICEGESLDSSVNELLLRNYVSMYVRQNDLNKIAETYETKVAHDTEVTAIRNNITGHETRITKNEGDIASLQSKVRTTETIVSQHNDEIITINQKLDDMQLDEVRRTLIDATNRVTVAENRISNTVEVVEHATNVVAQMESTVATHTEQISALDIAISNVVNAIALAIEDAKHHSDTNDVATLAAAERMITDATNDVVAAAAEDATAKANAAESAAKSYADTAAATAQAAAETNANAYTDAAIASATDREYVDQQDNIVSNAATAYTDWAISQLESGPLKYLHVGTTTSEPFVWTNGQEYVFIGGQSVAGPGAVNDPIVKTYNYDGLKYDLAIPPAAINIGIIDAYPSYTYSDYAISLGIDNKVGFGTGTSTNSSGIYNARYAIGIGTSVKAKMMHSYAIGSQVNALAGNSSVYGYGGSATSEWSTVIGHGRRPNGGSSTYDKIFTSWDDADTYLKTLSDNTFKGSHFEVKPSGSARTLYTIIGVRSTPDENGYYYDYLETPDDEYDYIPGGYDWRYGKSHGPGTFNIVAWHKNWKTSPGLKAVWINDDNLYDLVMDASGGNVTKKLTLTEAQKNKGITFVKDGYDQNSAVEIGDDATAALSQSYVSSLTKSTTLRNVSVAIGARANATNPNNQGTGQAVAIGYCANADGGQSIAIGPGAKHLTDETDENGHNAWAHGGTSIAIGYSTKAIGYGSVAIGSGQGGNTMASASNTVAIGRSAQVTAEGSVQLGTGINNEANTLKFQNTTIVKDGKLCGFDDTSLDPKEIDISGVEEVDMYPHIVNTLTTTNVCGPGTEIGLNPKGSRNYEVYVPNEDQFVHGLPLNFDSELPDGIKLLFMNNKDTASKLPVMIKVQQPSKKNVLITVNELDDGTDWTPVITNSFIKYDAVAGKFYSDGGKRSVEGKSLHHATEFKIVYPVDVYGYDYVIDGMELSGAGHIVTNSLMTADSRDGLISGTYYDYAVAIDFAPTNLFVDDSATYKTWYKIVYKTVNGDAEEFTVKLTSITR